MKVQINQARYKAQQQAAAQAQQKAADNNVQAKKRALDPHLSTYQTQMQHHQQQWVQHNRGQYATAAQAQQAWSNDWQNSDGGKRAEADVAPYLAAYNAAVRHDLRLTAQDVADNGGDAKAIQAAVARKANDLKPKGNSFGDQIEGNIVDQSGQQLGGVVDKKAGKVVGAESTQMRQAALRVDDAFTTRDQALAHLHDLQTRRDKALARVPNAGLRRDISDGFTDEINSAQGAVDSANADLKTDVDKEFAIAVSEQNLADAQAGMDGVKGLPPQLRKNEMQDAQRDLSAAQTQHQLAVDGKLDLTNLTQFTSDELGKAYATVLSNHPELMVTGQSDNPNAPVATDLFQTVAKLQYRPMLDANMTALSVDKSSPQWMQDLVNKGDRTTAALAMSLGVDKVAPKGGYAEKLAEKDPLAFIMLAYSDPHYISDLNNRVQPDGKNPNLDDATIIQKGEELATDKFKALMAPQGQGEPVAQVQDRQARAQQLIGLFGASGFVRANDVQ
ncbi:MAG: hypothetical protein WBP94_04075, partial [Rhodomicrobiaceae bacterium]